MCGECVISIHAPTRGTTLGQINLSEPHTDFNPRSHEGSDLECQKSWEPKNYFNPRSHEGSDYIRRAGNHIRCNFNPRSHEGSDGCSDIADQVDYISIHAPTRGATALIAIGVALYKFQSTLPRGERLPCIPSCHSHVSISIHAPTRGATRSHSYKCQCPTYFNPRSHEGSDRIAFRRTDSNSISIHAPTRGATLM